MSFFPLIWLLLSPLKSEIRLNLCRKATQKDSTNLSLLFILSFKPNLTHTHLRTHTNSHTLAHAHTHSFTLAHARSRTHSFTLAHAHTPTHTRSHTLLLKGHQTYQSLSLSLTPCQAKKFLMAWYTRTLYFKIKSHWRTLTHSFKKFLSWNWISHATCHVLNSTKHRLKPKKEVFLILLLPP